MIDPAGKWLRAALTESADRLPASGDVFDQILIRSRRARVRRTRVRAALAALALALVPVGLSVLRPNPVDELRFADEVPSDTVVTAPETVTASPAPRVWRRGDDSALRAGPDTYVEDVAALDTGLVAIGSTARGIDGADGLTWMSVDGGTWEQTSSDRAFSAPGVMTRLRAVAAGPLGVVAVGERDDRGTAWSSTDGRSWQESAVEQGAVVHDIAWAGGVWVAVGAVVQPAVRSSAVWTSPDGVAWTARAVESTSTDAFLDQVAVDGDLVVALGDGVAVSSDGGATWSAIDRATAGFGRGFTAIDGLVTLPGGGFLAVEGGPARPLTAYRSSDGRSWSVLDELATAAGTSRVSELLIGPSGELVAVGFSGTGQRVVAAVWTSSDGGATWTGTASEAFTPGTRLLGAAATATGLVAVGQDEVAAAGAAWRSQDG